MSTSELITRLRTRYGAPEYAFLEEVPNATSGRASRRADGLAMSLWQSRGLFLHGFEVKAQRSDWLRELRNPAKANEIARRCDYWWLVTAPGVAKVDEIPALWGWMEASGAGLKKLKEADKQQAAPIDRDFLAGILRIACEKSPNNLAHIEARHAGFQQGYERAKAEAQMELASAAARVKMAEENYHTFLERVREFEKETGISFSGFRKNGKDIGRAVNDVLAGGPEARQQQLVRRMFDLNDRVKDIAREFSCEMERLRLELDEPLQSNLEIGNVL